MGYNLYIITFVSSTRTQRPVGQAVKTPPFHGGNTGSNPVRVTIYLRWAIAKR